MRFETLAIHAGERPDAAFGSVSVPIYQTSTFTFEDVGKTMGDDYSRTANPTRKVLEVLPQIVAKLRAMSTLLKSHR